ncbi:MAG: hypothetical protein ACI4M6_05385 [Christensenellaceae bacterium]
MPPRNSDNLNALLYIKNFEGIWEKFGLSSIEFAREITSLGDALSEIECRIRVEGTLEARLGINGEELSKAVLDNDPQKDWEDMILKGVK